MKDGKLFGKFNIIDILVVLLVIVVGAVVALKMSGRFGPAVTEVGTDITYTVRVEGVDQEVYDQITDFIAKAKEDGYAGDQLMSNGALLNAYITEAVAVPHEAKAVISSMDGNIIIPVMEDTLDVIFTIEGHVSNDIKTELGSQEVRVGKIHIVKTTHFELINGTILTCEWAGGTGAERQ